jgi:hypothetical protein
LSWDGEAGRAELAVEHSGGAGGAKRRDAKRDGGNGKERATAPFARRHTVLFATTETDRYARPHVVGTWRGNSF